MLTKKQQLCTGLFEAGCSIEGQVTNILEGLEMGQIGKIINEDITKCGTNAGVNEKCV